MAAITPGVEDVAGVQADDVLTLHTGTRRDLKTATVAEVMHHGWDDLRFPAQGINPAGAASPPAVDEVLTSFTGTLLFSGSQENVIAGVAQMPHSWSPGTWIESSMLCWQIRRQGATDAESGTARLLEFDIHFYAVKAGTFTIVPPEI